MHFSLRFFALQIWKILFTIAIFRIWQSCIFHFSRPREKCIGIVKSKINTFLVPEMCSTVTVRSDFVKIYNILKLMAQVFS